VAASTYADAFGAQWNTFRRTQLDSHTGHALSRERLARCLGGSLEAARGKSVLEAGCGAGRFTEVLLAAGARVFACDLSRAVEANFENCHSHPDYFVAQADLMQLPVRPGSFDIVLCLGVIQHTPCPEATIEQLCRYVKPGGLLVLDHYRYSAEDMTEVRQRLRRFLLGTPAWFSLLFTRTVVALLWPAHRLSWTCRRHPRVAEWRRRLLVYSPVLDYHESYGQLPPRLLYAWAALDTHDALTDVYKHKRTPEQIAETLRQCGMSGVEASYGGNGVEARAVKPLAVTSGAAVGA